MQAAAATPSSKRKRDNTEVRRTYQTPMMTRKRKLLTVECDGLILEQIRKLYRLDRFVCLPCSVTPVASQSFFLCLQLSTTERQMGKQQAGKSRSTTAANGGAGGAAAAKALTQPQPLKEAKRAAAATAKVVARSLGLAWLALDLTWTWFLL
jgi:hypothetical protein